jgi:hypothetical protein
MHQRIFEGTWSEVVKEAESLSGDTRVRLEVVEPRKGNMIRKGMFPQLLALTDEDFKSAEWRGDKEFDQD